MKKFLNKSFVIYKGWLCVLLLFFPLICYADISDNYGIIVNIIFGYAALYLVLILLSLISYLFQSKVLSIISKALALLLGMSSIILLNVGEIQLAFIVIIVTSFSFRLASKEKKKQTIDE